MTSEKIYHNIRVLAPDGEKLSFVPLKRAAWYVRKGLAKWTGEKQLQLNFEPSGRSKVSDWYLVEHKNQCVVCGDTNVDLLQKHHVVPICLRTWMKDSVKRHRSFDVLMLCEDCHREYEVEAHLFKKELAEEVGIDWIGQSYYWRDLDKRGQALRHALSLRTGKVPQQMVAKLEMKVREAFGSIPTDEALHELQARLKRDRRDLADNFFRDLVAAHEPNENLVRRWRHHFVDVMEPGFLEPEWLADIDVVE